MSGKRNAPDSAAPAVAARQRDARENGRPVPQAEGKAAAGSLRPSGSGRARRRSGPGRLIRVALPTSADPQVAHLRPKSRLRLRGGGPQFALVPAHATSRRRDHRAPPRFSRQRREQALVEHRIGPLDRAPERRPMARAAVMTMRLGACTAVNPPVKQPETMTTVGARGAAGGQGSRQLGGTQELTAIGEPNTLAALTMRGDKDQTTLARTRPQPAIREEDPFGRGRFGAAPRSASR